MSEPSSAARSGLRATFLGHQGWLFAAGSTHVLLDPLLTPSFGHGGLLGELYPPRRFDWSAFPAIDAVVLSHEHDDHFDLPSLARLERSIPIYLAARASRAAFEVLRDMGFRVHPLPVEGQLTIGALRYRTFVADHRQPSSGDEWEVSPFVLDDGEGHCVLSSIDLAPDPGLLARASAVGPRPSLWIHAHNLTRTSFQRVAAGASSPPDTALVTAGLLRRYAELEAIWAAPELAALVGGGWSFPGARSWMNHNAFPVAAEQLARSLDLACPATTCIAATPGTTAQFANGQLATVTAAAAFVAPAARERWPARDYRGDVHSLTDYAPACGRRAFDASDEARLLVELGDFARFLYARPPFRALYSAPAQLPDGSLTAFAFALRRAGQAPLVLAYDPSGCRFVGHRGADPQASFAAGLECWASDLLALLTGEIAASALCYAGRLRGWNRDPARLQFSADELWTYAHPLRRPDCAAALYRRLLAAECDAPRLVRGTR